MNEHVEPYRDDLLALAVDLCPVGMLAADATGRILHVNREIERLFGYSRAEVLGQSVEMLVPQGARERHPDFRAGYLREPQTRRMGAGRDVRGLRKDGRHVSVEIGLKPVRTDRGTVVLASVVDIGARRLMEDQLRQSHKMEAIGTLAGGIAQDFNNILLAITGHTELAQRAKVLDAQHADDLAQVLHAAERGRQLVQRILTFSRVRKIHRTQVSTERIVRETLQLLRASLPSAIEIREVFDPETPDLFADETQIQQVLMNLVTNAAHAMPDGGELEVCVEPFHADEAFVRAHPTLASTSYVHVTVIDGGVGTRVDVYLPSAKAEVTRSAAPDQRKHILLVEDDPGLAIMLKRQLEGVGYRVSMHVSSKDALRAFQRQPEAFDLLMTDNTMPRLTGLMLAREVLAIRAELPVLLISGVEEIADPEALRTVGVTKSLPKPHTMRELEATVESLIGGPEG